MKLSVITLTYNNFEELKTTLGSVAGVDQVESFVVNGGQCEDTKKYLARHLNLCSISEPDEGISDAFNKGLTGSKAECVTFLNSGDILIDRDYYAFALDCLVSSPEIDFIYADILFNHPAFGKILVKPNHDIAKVPYPHPALIVRRSVFERIGNFDKNLKIAMDYDFMLRMKKENLKGIYYQKTPVVLMDGTGASSTQGFKAIAERLLILKRLDLLNGKSSFYFQKLALKMKIRIFLGKLGLLKTYDDLKHLFIKPKSE